MEYKLNLFRLRENKPMKAQTFVNLVSTSLYEKRFGPYFVSPIVVGLDDGVPILATYDSIGCSSESEDFAVGGTAGSLFYGLCEAYYREKTKPDILQETMAQILVNGIDRDILSGWGGIVYVL